MHTTFRLSVFLLFMVQLFCSCTSDSLPEPDSTQPEMPAGIPDAYQDKIRTQPYPKADNELYLNPALSYCSSSHEDGRKTAIFPFTY